VHLGDHDQIAGPQAAVVAKTRVEPQDVRLASPARGCRGRPADFEKTAVPQRRISRFAFHKGVQHWEHQEAIRPPFGTASNWSFRGNGVHRALNPQEPLVIHAELLPQSAGKELG
jgi:hypothetical protein